VDAPTIVDKVAFVLQFAERGAEAFSQQLRDETAQCLVSRPGGHRADDSRQAVCSPTVCHFSPLFSGGAVVGPYSGEWSASMRLAQEDLLAQDTDEHNTLSEPQRSVIRPRLEAILTRLEAAPAFPWHD